MACAPGKTFQDGSCLSFESLTKIANKYNELNKTNPVKIHANKIELVNELKNIFYNSCNDNQVCWLKQKAVKETKDLDILKNTFRPIGPTHQYEWLSTTHIDDVVKQYENYYPSFKFLGAVPYDFEDLSVLEVANINFDDLINKKKTKIGMIINLDTHNKGGSHWVALYLDLENNKIYFSDSAGNKPGKRIRKFNNKVISYIYNKIYNSELNINNIFNKIKKKKYNDEKIKNILSNIDIRYNKIKHQHGTSECGVYSINFILRLAKGETFEEITGSRLPDEKVNKCRDVYFNKKV